MGVWDDIPRERIDLALARWDRGVPVAVEATPLGIENSNFFVRLRERDGREREWVLTVLAVPPSPTGLTVLSTLDAAALPVPAPVADVDGAIVGRVGDRPALLAPRLPGDHPERPTAAQCRAVGDFLGRMHALSASLDGPPHPRSLAWMRAGLDRQGPGLDAADRALLATAIGGLGQAMGRRDWRGLPSGVVHGDLFRDNALFVGPQLSAVIDFHHAARAPLAFDLAVVVDDWCSEADGHLDADRMIAVLRAYAAHRPPTATEWLHWPLLTVLAATRFWLARLASPRKPPAEMRARLAARLAAPPRLDPDLLRPGFGDDEAAADAALRTPGAPPERTPRSVHPRRSSVRGRRSPRPRPWR